MVVAAGVLAAGIAYAAIPGPGGVIRGCYISSGGQLRVIDTGSCRSGETPLSWNAQGPSGPSGASGASGPPGASALQVVGRVVFNGTINAGTGFAVTHPATGEYDLTFTPPFTGCLVNLQVTPISTPATSFTALAGCVAKIFIRDPVTLMPDDENFQFLATQD